jgi:hypothetical protein
MIGLRVTLNKPFGALGGYIVAAENALTPARIGFRGFLLLGLVLGGVAYAFLAGSIAPSLSYGTAGGLLPEQCPASSRCFSAPASSWDTARGRPGGALRDMG